MYSDPTGRPGPRGGLLIYVPGAALLLLGCLILLNEELLRYLVAGFFVLVGLILLSAAWQLQRGAFGGRVVRLFQDRWRS